MRRTRCFRGWASSWRCTSPRPSRRALNESDLDPELIERERAIAAEKAGESGKSAEIITKMVDGAIAKYRKENALVSQLFVMDGKTKISDVVAKAGKDAGTTIVLKDYVRFQLGEGIEKEASDFAAEVAAVSGVPQKDKRADGVTNPPRTRGGGPSAKRMVEGANRERTACGTPPSVSLAAATSPRAGRIGRDNGCPPRRNAA